MGIAARAHCAFAVGLDELIRKMMQSQQYSVQKQEPGAETAT
jgi:hypothetical protein